MSAYALKRAASHIGHPAANAKANAKANTKTNNTNETFHALYTVHCILYIYIRILYTMSSCCGPYIDCHSVICTDLHRLPSAITQLPCRFKLDEAHYHSSHPHPHPHPPDMR